MMALVRGGFALLLLLLIAAAMLALVAPMVEAVGAVRLPEPALVTGVEGLEPLQLTEAELSEDQVTLALTQVIVNPSYSHAAEEHPEDLPIVRKCLEDPNTWKSAFRTTERGRFLQVCYDGKNIIFQIIDQVRGALYEKTAYIKNGMSNITDLTRYVDKMRYFRIKGGL